MTDEKPKHTVIDPAAIEPRTGSIYPEPFAASTQGREKRGLGSRAGLTQFGVNLTTLKPGAASALRHWHANEDEFVYVVEGELTLVTDAGSQVLGPGMAAGFPAGVEDGHHLVNDTDRDAVYLEIGSRAPTEEAHYPDVDLHARRDASGFHFFRKDGTPY